MQEPTTLLLYISHTSPQYNEQDMGEAKLKVIVRHHHDVKVKNG